MSLLKYYSTDNDGELSKAVQWYGQALDIAERLGTDTEKGDLYHTLGVIYRLAGDPRSEEMHNKGLAIEAGLGRPDKMADHLGSLGQIYQERQEQDEAVVMFERAIRLNENLGRNAPLANQYGRLGTIYMARKDYQKAETNLLKSRELNFESGRRDRLAIDYGNLGRVYFAAGNMEEAQANYQNSASIHDQLLRRSATTSIAQNHRLGMANAYHALGLIEFTRTDDRANRQRAKEYLEGAAGLFKILGLTEKEELVRSQLDGYARQ